MTMSTDDEMTVPTAPGRAKRRADRLAAALLRDRDERAARKSARTAPSRSSSDFDPFQVTRWRVVAGPNPGHMPKTRARQGPTGWFIACERCGVEFESKGWRYCSSCMALPAEERRRDATPAPSERRCERCGGPIPRRARGDASYCSRACRRSAANARAYEGRFSTSSGANGVGSGLTGFSTSSDEILQQNQEPFSVLIGPTDRPINLLGGHKHPGAPVLDRELRRAIIKAEVGELGDGRRSGQKPCAGAPHNDNQSTHLAAGEKKPAAVCGGTRAET
jgi:hypothetical protein